MEEVFESPCENLENFVKLLDSFCNFGVNGETKGLCCLMGFWMMLGLNGNTHMMDEEG
jgi:hypothetical protein